MGIIVCPTHGRAVLAETCEHIAQQVAQGRTPDGHRLPIPGHLFVCDACFDQLGLAGLAAPTELPEASIDVDENGLWPLFDAAHDRLERKAVFCLSCLRALGAKLCS
ncbi:hypothetical protein [Bradyrhizobium sp. HKCCYLR20261]|uniref:hypothetical protein n=1 Tax=unclassified Bradyrhizobium TaxID=2631580 RepID=UPI003EB8E824